MKKFTLYPFQGSLVLIEGISGELLGGEGLYLLKQYAHQVSYNQYVQHGCYKGNGHAEDLAESGTNPAHSGFRIWSPNMASNKKAA